MGNTNMKIAKLHRASRKFTGFITAAGTIIAYALSFLTVAAGVVLYAMIMFPNSKGYWIVAGAIAILFSLLVERMTLTQAAKVRQANESRDDINFRYAKIEAPTEDVKKNQEKEIKDAVKGRSMAFFWMCFGVIVSTAAGTLFWHYILQPLPAWQAWAFSTVFSMIISFTLVGSELHRRLENKVVGESIVADHFIGAAAAEDARDSALNEFANKHDKALDDVLDNRTVVQMADAAAMQTIDSAFGGQGMIPMHVSRERLSAQASQQKEAELTREQMKMINEQAKASNNNGNGHSKVTAQFGKDSPDVLQFKNPFSRGAH